MHQGDLLGELHKKDAPLAERMRPRTIEEFVGQRHILAPGRLLRRCIEADKLSSLIFYGPPGTGKTTLAKVIANSTKSSFLMLNAVLDGVKEIRACIDKAQNTLTLRNRRTILFIDEVHRFNKSQQDALLPHVENGLIIFIGATTENPYFEVNKALISRSNVFQFKALQDEELQELIHQVLEDPERGYGRLNLQLTAEAVTHLCTCSNGDARVLMNALELAVISSDIDPLRPFCIDRDLVEDSMQQKAVLYDKDGDYHYDVISAFIKSLRGSDVDSALYWMTKMIYAGENPRFIFRRMIIFACEDIGMADPQALMHTISAMHGFEFVGMPEGAYLLSVACIYLASCPKSNSSMAYFEAMRAVEKETDSDVPNHLKDSNRDKDAFGHGKGYLYPHSYKEHFVPQQYLPDALIGRIFYTPSDQGHEAEIKVRTERLRELQLIEYPDSQSAYVFTELAGNNPTEYRAQQRHDFFDFIGTEPTPMILIPDAERGWLAAEAMRRFPHGTFYGNSREPSGDRLLAHLLQTAAARKDVVFSAEREAEDLIRHMYNAGIRFDLIFWHVTDIAYADAFLGSALLPGVWQPNGKICLMVNNPSEGSRLSNLLEQTGADMDNALLSAIQHSEIETLRYYNQQVEIARMLDKRSQLRLHSQKNVTHTFSFTLSRAYINRLLHPESKFMIGFQADYPSLVPKLTALMESVQNMTVQRKADTVFFRIAPALEPGEEDRN